MKAFKIILFNGPPKSGKDTLADIIKLEYNYPKHQFKDRLYEIGSKIARMDLETYKSICSDRDIKDVNGAIRGWEGTPREHLIYVSEDVIKPLFGDEYFGKTLADISSYIYGITGSGGLYGGIVVPDSGFMKELYPLCDITPMEGNPIEIHVVQLTKDGCSFEGDSRSYLDKREMAGMTFSINPIFHNIDVVHGDIEGTIKLIDEAVGGL